MVNQQLSSNLRMAELYIPHISTDLLEQPPLSAKIKHTPKDSLKSVHMTTLETKGQHENLYNLR